jgi:hypothetical protein
MAGSSQLEDGMKNITVLVAMVVLSCTGWGQDAQGSAGRQQRLKDIIDKVKAVSPDGAANLLLMRQVKTQEPVTGSGYLRGKVEPFRGVAWQALKDFVSIQLCADLIMAKGSRPQAAKDAVRALGGLIGWGDRAAEDFDTAEIKNIPAKRPFDQFTGLIYTGLDELILTSTDSDWPSAVTGSDKNAELLALESVSPKAVKDILMTRELVKQTPTRTGNAAVDQEIADAKNLAVESLKNWASMELYSDLLIAKENEDKNVPAALKVISGPKYATDKIAFENAFDEGVQIGPKLGHVTMITAGWLGPEVVSTVARLMGISPTP